ncbi:discoidin domain-containing receptor 2-like [Polistes fuscatus]|uniref:discoidin domain-containing receptor 2-like n=1 Tax=Polistes fuscatus TaxID=30207 RepID=UPI001CA94F56|nr:discoidin domain-containing receptor 2-like [Polistes fuscatus]XP_043505183.1 discoidin domain-containing receptor 2-like [Polistes fuscatus]
MKNDRPTMILSFCALLLLLRPDVCSLEIRSCNQSLGMESGDIPDSSITASSSYVTNVGPRNGRLRKETAGGAWCPRSQIERGIREWLQVDLPGGHVITGVQTQGRFDHGRGQEYVEEYTLEYRRPTFTEWRRYKRSNNQEVFPGNSDTSTVISHNLVPPIFASQIRILPHSVHRRTVCLRIELRGCQDTSGIVSYTIPESPMEELSDTSYDGKRQYNSLLTDGLGRLIDGEVGADNYRLDMGDGRGTGWVAWMRDTFPNDFVEIILEFENYWIFEAVYIYTNNYFSRDVQVFSKADIWFSQDGEYYENEPIAYSYIPDIVLENARNVTIDLRGRQGKFLKFHLYFAARWIMIGEIMFDKSNPYENLTEDTTLVLEDGETPVSPNADLNLNLQTVTAPSEGQDYLEVLIGVLTAIILLLVMVFLVILLLNRRQKLQSSPTVLKNPFGFTINMKGLLLNLTPGSMLNDGGNHASVDAPEDVSVHESLTMEQFDSPLVSPHYKSTYAIVANSEPSKDSDNSTISEENVRLNNRTDSILEPPPSRSSSPTESTSRHVQHYRTLQSYSSSNNNKFNIITTTTTAMTTTTTTTATTIATTTATAATTISTTTTTNYRRDIDRTHSKRWHTTPKEKSLGLQHNNATSINKIPAPVVTWNIAPSMNKPYKCKEIEPTGINRLCLRTTEKLGSSIIGEAIVCETVDLDDVIPSAPRLVVARVPSCINDIRSGHISSSSSSSNGNNNAGGIGMPGTNDQMREVSFLSGLSDPNVARILGVCAAEPAPWTIIEYTELGDLAHYLQYSVPLTGTLRPTCNLKTLSQNCLLYMGTQIASGMRYLESKNLVHKDLAARNCLVGRSYAVKVTDIAMCSDLYKKDYSDIGAGRPPAPIRWLPWESILLDRYTCASSTWSFAVTLWEVMSLAREKPFQHLTNEQVIRNAEHMYYGEESQVFLPKPTMCPDDVYKMMCSCWRRDEEARPSFKDIYSFLKNTIADYRPGT